MKVDTWIYELTHFTQLFILPNCKQPHYDLLLWFAWVFSNVILFIWLLFIFFIVSMLSIWKWFYKYLLYFRQVQSTEFDFDDDDIGTTPKVTPQRLPGMLYFCTVYGIHNQIQIIFMWISLSLLIYMTILFSNNCKNIHLYCVTL